VQCAGSDDDFVAAEECGASGVTEEADGDKRSGLEAGEEMGLSCVVR
jgi:hypothetical protein